MIMMTTTSSTTTNPQHPLLKAVVHNNLTLLEQDDFILHHATPSSLAQIRSFDGKTPLHLASLLGFHECVHRLLELGAPVDPLDPLLQAVDRNGNTALHLATFMNHKECVSLLLGAGSLPFHPRNRNGHSPFDLVDEDSIRQLYNLHFIHKPVLDLSIDSHTRSVFKASLPSNSEHLQAMLVSMAYAATLFESNVQEVLRRITCNNYINSGTSRPKSLNSHYQQASGMASRETQLQYLVEENKHLLSAAGTLRRHIRALEQDIEAKDDAFRTHLNDLTAAHRREVLILKQVHARHLSDLDQRASMLNGGTSILEHCSIDTPELYNRVHQDLNLNDQLNFSQPPHAQFSGLIAGTADSKPEKVSPADNNNVDHNPEQIVFATGITGETYIKAAAVDVLVARLVSGYPADYSFRTTFLLTFREFMTINEFFEKLKATHVFGNPAIALRIGDIVFDWINRFWFDFAADRELLRRVMSFLMEELAKCDQTAMVPRIEELIQTRLASVNENHIVDAFGSLNIHSSSPRRYPTDPPKSILPKYLRRIAPPLAETIRSPLSSLSGSSIGQVTLVRSNLLVPTTYPSISRSITEPDLRACDPEPESVHGSLGAWLHLRPLRHSDLTIKLSDWDMLEVARQITIIEADLFRAISPLELIGLKWMRKDKEEVSPTLMRITRWSNHVVQWIVTEIVNVRDLKARAAVYERFVFLAVELARLNNYNGLKEVLAAFDSSSIYRLRKTKALVSRKAHKLLDELNTRMNPQMNYKSMRQEVRSIEGPMVPFPGLIQTDMMFIDTVFKKETDGLINFVRYQKLADYVLEVQEQQMNAVYVLEVVPEIGAYVLDFQVLDQDAAYSQSLVCESRS